MNLKKLLFDIKYKSNKTYSIPLKKIKIQKSFLMSSIRPKKWEAKLQYYKSHHCFQSEIILNENFVLIDGYSSYLIAKKYGYKKVYVKFLKQKEKN